MARNANLGAAKAAKNDEFYTQWNDIENEMQAYLEYDPDVFRGKTVLLPCDDPEVSNFTKFFALNFESLGLKKLISTSYATRFNPANEKRGRIYVLERGEDINEGGRANKEDLKWDHLEGNGDFRSDEVTKLRDEADIVVTNPPFSLFRKFLAWLIEGGVQFSIIGNMNSVAGKEVFPLIKEGRLWLGATGNSNDMVFRVPEGVEVRDSDRDKAARLGYPSTETEFFTRMGNTCWFSNVQHGRRCEPLPLMTMDDNLRYNKRIMGSPNSYKNYDNYDAIEVPFTSGIPSDYEGVMGVPISFLDKCNPEQFEIVGMAKRGDVDPALETRVYTAGDYPNYSSLNAGPVIMENGIPRNTYSRILIRHRQPETKES